MDFYIRAGECAVNLKFIGKSSFAAIDFDSGMPPSIQ
jgi:hypothetical protein